MATSVVEQPVAARSARYVYGVVSAAAAGGRSRGVGGNPVRLLVEGGVAALISDVPLEEFGETSLYRNLNDPVWLEVTARAHERVVADALAGGAVVPFRLGTLYHADEHVRAFLAQRQDALVRLLNRLEGAVELGVKAWFDRALYGAPEAPAAVHSGRDYLVRRRREAELARAADRFRGECAAASHELLAAAAQASTVNPPQPRELTGRPEQMILNGAYLVDRGDDALAAAVRALESRYGSRGVSYELTGPWPPYNFVEGGV
jgi:hypothetical protein